MAATDRGVWAINDHGTCVNVTPADFAERFAQSGYHAMGPDEQAPMQVHEELLYGGNVGTVLAARQQLYGHMRYPMPLPEPPPPAPAPAPTPPAPAPTTVAVQAPPPAA
jgi:hypothetical protein